MTKRSSAERLLRVALRLYPASFRARFEAELVQVCLEDLRVAGVRGSTRSPGRTLLATLFDLTRSGIGERIVGSGSVAPTSLARALGFVGIVGGLIFLAAFAIWIPGTFNSVRLILFNAGAVASALGAYGLLTTGTRRWAAAIVALVVLANVAYGLGIVYTSQFERAFADGRGVVFSWLGHALWLADALFGLVALRLGGAARLAGIALLLGGFGIVGIVPGLGSLWEPGAVWQALALAGVGLNGVGWIVLGLIVAFRGIPAEREPAAA